MITKQQKSILYGSILGDGYLQKIGKQNARLRFEHGFKQKDFLFWKIEMLDNFFQGKPKYLERIHPIAKKKYCYWRHQSQSTPYLGKLRRIFYPEGKKQIPQDLEKFLDPLALAVWFMDDGYFYQKDKNGYLYLGNVSLPEAEKTAEVFREKFALIVSVKKKKKGFALYFSPTEAKKLKILIGRYILPMFAYKLPA